MKPIVLSTIPAFQQISKDMKINQLNQIQSQLFGSFVYD